MIDCWYDIGNAENYFDEVDICFDYCDDMNFDVDFDEGRRLIVLCVWRGICLLKVGELFDELICCCDAETLEGNRDIKGDE